MDRIKAAEGTPRKGKKAATGRFKNSAAARLRLPNVRSRKGTRPAFPRPRRVPDKGCGKPDERDRKYRPFLAPQECADRHRFPRSRSVKNRILPGSLGQRPCPRWTEQSEQLFTHDPAVSPTERPACRLTVSRSYSPQAGSTSCEKRLVEN